MAKTLTIQISEDLEQVLVSQARLFNKSLEEVVVEILSQKLPGPPQPQPEVAVEDDPILKLIGSLHLDGITDLGENHDYYIGQALYREMHPDE